MKADNRLAVAALLLGLTVGFFIGRAGGDRYQLKDCGIEGAVYKIDTRTGQTWLVIGGRESPVQPK